jgi:hypothetical protein|tara:strand:+ start:71 stop:409 length:339 start_codon:yes stop_codon:yes gene_type:complete
MATQTIFFDFATRTMWARDHDGWTQIVHAIGRATPSENDRVWFVHNLSPAGQTFVGSVGREVDGAPRVSIRKGFMFDGFIVNWPSPVCPPVRLHGAMKRAEAVIPFGEVISE